MHGSTESDGRLRVVTLIDGIGLSGGGERLAREIVARLDRGRFERTLCVSRWSPSAAAEPAGERALRELGQAGVRVLGLNRRSSLDVGAWRPMLSLLRRERVDVLHAHKFGSNVWASILGSAAGTPVVVAHEHTWSFEGQPLRRLLDRELIGRRVNAFLAVSRADRRRMIDIEGIDPGKVIFVPNGIPDPPAPSGRDLRAELGIPPGAPVIGTVGTLRAQKAFDVLVRAAARLSGRFPDLRVLIAGEGEERPRLERLIDDLQLGETVSLLGRRSDVPDLLGALQVAVCCSEFEGSPLSVMEYMEAGLPVVATRVGGVPDLIEHGVHGLLIEPGRPELLAAAIAEQLSDRGRAAEMGRRARERRRSEFSIERTVERIEELYVELRAGAGRRSRRRVRPGGFA